MTSAARRFAGAAACPETAGAARARTARKARNRWKERWCMVDLACWR
ncbi:MAG: hypothetical protein NT080_08375 [Spirochaetes bacterium]|nr:hypothetical protein [Spirochaetota bacterium]